MDRRRQNKALRDFQELDAYLDALRPIIKAVLIRASGDSDIRKNLKQTDDPEAGTQTTHYADTTGEAATRRQIADSVELSVDGIAHHLHLALNLAKKTLDVTPSDVAERAKREIPDCTLCGDPISGRIRYGRWDEKCLSRYRRWVDAGNYPDRDRFESVSRIVDGQVTPATPKMPEKDWRIEMIDTLQERGDLPVNGGGQLV